jgi:acetyl/propionyl-CoA carboxylase alpha subunit
VIAKLGDKVAARRLMAGAGVPVVPGYDKPGASDDALVAAARRLGAPLMIKAAGGGGGRGMRLVERQDNLRPLLAAARREALAAFGSGDLFLERYLAEVRHIEIQVLADHAGAIATLGERECSVQRRHQKLIEEAPSPFATASLRAALSHAAIAAAQAAGYVNAGSVEFLVEPSRQFYFLEVNTRLQVEHGVTEWVTGVDLVKSQLRIADGKPLAPDPIDLRGHAIECRVYAEDPASGYAPSPGPVLALEEPAGPGVRVDSGLHAGWQIPTAYDPLLAKIIAWDRTRADADLPIRQRASRVRGIEQTSSRDGAMPGSLNRCHRTNDGSAPALCDPRVRDEPAIPTRHRPARGVPPGRHHDRVSRAPLCRLAPGLSALGARRRRGCRESERHAIENDFGGSE